MDIHRNIRNKKGQFIKGQAPWNKGLKGCISIGSFKKGHVPWSKGKKMSKEYRDKLSKIAKEKGFGKWSKGKHHSEEVKIKMSKIHKGKHLSPSTEFKKGHKHSKSALEKMSKTWIKKGQRLGIGTEFKKGNIPWSKGKKFMSDEFYKKLSLSGLKKQMNMNEPTSIEKKVYEELKNRGLLFEKQKIINGKFIVDAYIPSLNLVIEADGDYWHSLDNIRKRDKSKNAYFKKCGFNLLRLTETEINNDNFKSKLDKIEGGKYG